MTHPDERRPGLQTEAAGMSFDGDDSSVAIVTDNVVRCRRCHHALTADASIGRGIGPRCRHLEHREVA